ncbi:sulfurtransferase [Uliginosibacterium sp. H1]|uniref:sulfurtransferase n=1 Tax=Uliginosibacterium sp. H1 TaxID=3114757 RepID=UPI002E19F367|nr:sulfurtransferase [Uliginosibacterium sp. H1]
MHTRLVSADTLATRDPRADWLLLDVRHDLANPTAGEQAYAQGHIPGAFFLHLDRDLSGAKNGRNGRHPLPARADFAARMAALGLTPATQVVAYDAQGGMFAARLWWMLRWLGHEAVAVLDGGLPAWTGAGHALDTDAPAPRSAATQYEAPSRVPVRHADEILARLGDATQLIVDARAADRFRGENETLDPVGGHIPGARNRFFKDNLEGDGRFKSAAQLREEWQQVLGATPPTEAVHQCGSGVTACHNLLALEVAGLAGGMLYPGSWSEWCSEPSRPVERA